MIQGLYCRENLDANHSLGFRVKSVCKRLITCPVEVDERQENNKLSGAA